VQQRCAALGLRVSAEELDEVYRTLMAVADDRKTITDADVVTVVAGLRSPVASASTDRALDPFDLPLQAAAVHEAGYGHGV
jgi:hypothetical protein